MPRIIDGLIPNIFENDMVQIFHSCSFVIRILGAKLEMNGEEEAA